MKRFRLLSPLIFIALLSITYAETDTESLFSDEAAPPIEESCFEETSAFCKEESVCPEQPRPKWYFAVKPGYYYLTDGLMRQFYGDGGFTIRGEVGYNVWGPFDVWLDGGYFQKGGHSIGGFASTEIKLATITLGAKAFYDLNEWAAFYAGIGPRLFMLMMHNDSPYVRSEDNAIGIGGGFDAGAWIFPIPSYRDFFLDVFLDYSLKNMHIEEDEISSYDFDVDLSGLSVGLGVGLRF